MFTDSLNFPIKKINILRFSVTNFNVVCCKLDEYNLNLTIMKRTILLFVATLIFGCTTKGVDVNKEELKKSVQLDGVFENFIKKTNMNSTTIPLKRDSLENMRTVVKVYNGKDNVGISVPGFGDLKLGKEEINLNVYYVETKVVEAAHKKNIVYGIGYSAHYLFKKVKKGLDVSKLPYVAASVQMESDRTQVFYSLRTYGMKSVNLVKYFKPVVNKSFDVEGFGIMQSSIDGIHNVMGDTILSKSVTFTPEVLKFINPKDLE